MNDPVPDASADAETPAEAGVTTETDGTAAPNPNEASVPETSSESSPSKASGYSSNAHPAAPSALVEKAKEERPRRSVGFDMRSNTMNSYTPSESSEEWDPNDDTDESYEDAPEEIAGYLWKKSPSTLPLLSRYQQRYFRVKNAKIHWWKSFQDFEKGPKQSKGCLDLKANSAELKKEDSVKFTIQPETGHWTSGTFTGYHSGRKFLLDTTNSEHQLSEWIRVLEAHLTYAKEHPIF